MPFQTAWDAAGAVEPGAKLYFYVTGTTTPKDTYSNSGLSVANANPMIADAAGRFGAIFLGSGDYKVILQDADGVQIWSADPVARATPASATTTVAGIVELATQAEGLVGTSTSLVPPVSVVTDMIQQGFMYATGGGTANAQTATLSISPPALAAGMAVVMKATVTNTGATTLNLAGLGAVAVKVAGGAGATACSGGEIVSGNTYKFVYSASDSAFLVSPIGEGVGALNALTEDSSPDGSADFFGMWDASAKLPKKVKPQSLAATQAQQELGAIITAFVTPLRQQYHKSAMKGQCSFNGTGVVAIYSNSDYNVSSITDNGTGTYVVNYTTAFGAATSHGSTISTDINVATNQYAELDTAASKTTTTQGVGTGQNTGGTRIDKDPIDVMTFGDFA